MTTKTKTINLRPFNVTQFDSLDEALKTIPEELALKYINYGWNNTQMTKLVDALRK